MGKVKNQAEKTESSVATLQQEAGEHVCEVQKPENSGERTDADDQELEAGGGGTDAEDKELEKDSEGADGSGEDEIPKDLVAIYPILYLSHQYKVGEKLPASDPGMVQAWLDAGTATWRTRKGQRPIARPTTAEPGLPVQAAGTGSGYGDALAGKIPRAGIGRW